MPRLLFTGVGGWVGGRACDVRVRACMRACVRACMRACVCACVRVCVCACVPCVRACEVSFLLLVLGTACLLCRLCDVV